MSCNYYENNFYFNKMLSNFLPILIVQNNFYIIVAGKLPQNFNNAFDVLLWKQLAILKKTN